MIDFLYKSKKNHPVFWKKYLEEFKQGLSQDISKLKFIVFDTETTGLDITRDRILSIGALKLKNQTINVNESLDIYLSQEIFNPDTVQIHGIIKNNKYDKMTEYDAIVKFIKYIGGNTILVGHHVLFDVKMINEALKRNGLSALKNRCLDTSNLFRKIKVINYFLKNEKLHSLEEICEELSVSTKDRHTALGDAYMTAIVFLKILSRFNQDEKLTLRKLIRKNKLF